MLLHDTTGLSVLQERGGHRVFVIVLRCVIVVLALWVLWKLFTTFFPVRQSREHKPEKPRHDEWAEVLEQIENLPETADPHSRVDAWRRSRRS
jgi:hypothetical protein